MADRNKQLADAIRAIPELDTSHIFYAARMHLGFRI
jgi:hypothetical protein